jgi:GT2 family glycosyltransferase
VSAARNLGIRSSSGRYISLLDDDDEYLPRFLEETLRTFERGKGLGFTWCGVQMVHDTPEGEKPVRERVWRLRFDTPAQVRRSRLAASRIGTGFGLTVRRDCFEEVGLFDESLLIEDTDFLLRLLAHGVRFDSVPEILVRVHRHPGPKLSRRFLEPKHMQEHEQLLYRYAGSWSPTPRSRPISRTHSASVATARATAGGPTGCSCRGSRRAVSPSGPSGSCCTSNWSTP